MSDFTFFPPRDATKARRAYACEWCGTPIEVGEVHSSWSYTDDGTVRRLRAHSDCIGPLNDSAEDGYICMEGHTRGKTCEEHG